MPRVKTFNEQEILEKAMLLFWEKGYYATSIQDLVNHLGINRASLYDTYGGKKELFNRSFELYRNKSIEGITTFLNGQDNVKAGLKAFFDAAIEEAKNDQDRKGCFVVNSTTEFIPGDREMHVILSKNKATVEKLFYDYLKKGELENQFEKGKDLKSIASLLFMLFNGLRIVSKVDPNKAHISKTIATALSLLD